MKSYPKSKDTPNRKNRKSARGKIFMDNAKASKKARNDARRARNEARNESN